MLRFSSLVLVLAMLTAAGSALANDASGRNGIGLEAGAMKLVGGHENFSNIDEEFGIHLRRGLSPHWSLQVGLNAGWLHPGGAANDIQDELGHQAIDQLFTQRWSPRVDLLYHFRPEKRFSPFAGLGLGPTWTKVKDMRVDDSRDGPFPDGPVMSGYDESGKASSLEFGHFTTTFGIGFEYYASDDFSIEVGARHNLLLGDAPDNIGLSSDTVYGAGYADANHAINDVYLGITWYWGNKDKDKDGIVGKLDRCPDAAEDFDGFQDEDGCPDLDNDGDGIPDDLDTCPDDAEDRDGFQDDDGCPDLDNDGDGIPDSRDRCPDTAEDRDGFEDADGCPDPDNDGDGVADALDRCPDTPAGIEVDADGCPVVAEIREALTLQGVTFASGSADLTPESEAVLDRVALSLRAWPEVHIEIQGHTDSSGKAERNLNLSQQRANSVRDYFVAVGIDGARITATGYGETFPVADNGTARGRAKNRRVEIHRIDR